MMTILTIYKLSLKVLNWADTSDGPRKYGEDDMMGNGHHIMTHGDHIDHQQAQRKSASRHNQTCDPREYGKDLSSMVLHHDMMIIMVIYKL